MKIASFVSNIPTMSENSSYRSFKIQLIAGSPS